jgi:hypothetical protein
MTGDKSDFRRQNDLRGFLRWVDDRPQCNTYTRQYQKNTTPKLASQILAANGGPKLRHLPLGLRTTSLDHIISPLNLAA